MHTVIVGNLVRDPELRVTGSGLPVTSFTVAVSKRVQVDGEWRDGEPQFVDCSVWREQAEHLAESLRKGQRVIAAGEFKSRKFEDRDGNPRTVWELTVDEVGPSVRFANVTIQRAEPARREPTPQQDPWSQPTSTEAPF